MIDGKAHDANVWAQAINSHVLVEYSRPEGGDEPVDLADADEVRTTRVFRSGWMVA